MERSWQTPLDPFESAPEVHKLHRFLKSPEGSIIEDKLLHFKNSLRIAIPGGIPLISLKVHISCSKPENTTTKEVLTLL